MARRSQKGRKPRALTVKGGMPGKKERQRYKSIKGQKTQALREPSTASISRASRMRSKFEHLAVEAKNKGDTLGFVFWNLKALRDGRIEERPRKRISGRDPKSHLYKFRGNFVTGVKSFLDIALSSGLIDPPELKQKIFRLRLHDFKTSQGRLLTRADIKWMNNVLSEVISHLKKKMPKK